jgi:hypothetical protein
MATAPAPSDCRAEPCLLPPSPQRARQRQGQASTSGGGGGQQQRRWWGGGGGGGGGSGAAPAAAQQLPAAARQQQGGPDLPPEAREKVAGLLDRLMGADAARAAEQQQRALSQRQG